MEENYYNSSLDEFFEILGVSKDASFEELKKAHRKQAMKYHPDRNPGDKEAERKMKAVNDAYDILKSNESRKKWVIENSWKNQSASTSDRNYHGNPNDRRQKTSYQERTRRNRYRDPYGNDDDETFKYNTRDTEEQKSKAKPNFKDYKEFLKYIKEEYKKAYKTVRAEEKSYTFGDRIDDIIQELKKWEFYQSVESKLGKLGIGISSLIVGELFWQLAKLKPEKGENIPTYTVKNRRTIAAALLIAMLFNPLGAKAEDAPNEPSTNTGTTVEEPKTTENGANVLVDEYCLNRIYKVNSGDTLSSISAESNTTMNHIAEVNGLNSYDLKVGQTIKIPYYIDKEDLQYYTTTAEVADYRDLEQLAKAYETDLRTLYSINVESFVKVDGQYASISDTILVPTFPTRQEVKDLKNNNNNSYQKTPNN